MVNSYFNITLLGAGDAPLDSSAYIIFTIIGLVVLSALTALLVFRVRKDYYIAKYIGYDKGFMTMERFKVVADKIARLNNKSLKYGFFRIDIRQYEKMKDTIGEEQVKGIITEMISIMQNLVPWGIRIAHDGQKTFYVIMVVNEQYPIENLCRLLISNLDKDYEIGADFSIDININVAAGSIPEAGNSFEELAKSMEITMVISKRQGHNHYVLYSIKYSNEESPEYKLYQEIKEAINDKEFILHYQPIVETNNFEVVSAESLIRWAHKTKGLLPPKEFLTILEQTGDIIWVGEWSAEQMIAQYQQWQAEGSKHFSVSYNMSIKQLMNPKLLPSFKKIMRRYRVEAADIIFEISDIGMYNLSDIVKENIDGLAQMGCKIFIDDFGSKFSSPTGLLDLPISGIKIGRSFWTKMATSKMVANTISILVDYAKENGLMLVAVGVENREDMTNLRNMGINYMQGYLFSAQKDPKDFIADVATTPWVDVIKRKKSRAAIDVEEAPNADETPKADNQPNAAETGEVPAAEEKPATAAEEPAAAEGPAQQE